MLSWREFQTNHEAQMMGHIRKQTYHLSEKVSRLRILFVPHEDKPDIFHKVSYKIKDRPSQEQQSVFGHISGSRFPKS